MRALKFWESLGFKKEGVERDAHYYDNEYSNGIMMSILEDEFKKTHKDAAVKKSGVSNSCVLKML
jgi:ribosomal protein S18 acetylase RimI-like enzyme